MTTPVLIYNSTLQAPAAAATQAQPGPQSSSALPPPFPSPLAPRGGSGGGVGFTAGASPSVPLGVFHSRYPVGVGSGGGGASWPIDCTSPRWLAWIPGIDIVLATGCTWIGASSAPSVLTRLTDVVTLRGTASRPAALTTPAGPGASEYTDPSGSPLVLTTRALGAGASSAGRSRSLRSATAARTSA